MAIKTLPDLNQSDTNDNSDPEVTHMLLQSWQTRSFVMSLALKKGKLFRLTQNDIRLTQKIRWKQSAT